MTTTKNAKGISESGVFPVIHVREVDVDRLLVEALDAVLARPCVEIERSGIDDAESMVLGDRSHLARAFTSLVSTCLACMERSAPLRISRRRDLGEWVLRVAHSVRADVPLDEGAAELAFTGSVVLGHDGTFVVRTDPTRRVRVIVASLPFVAR